MSFLSDDEKHADLISREEAVRKAWDDIQQFRSALAADRERVEMVVHEILNVILTEEEPRWSIAKHQKVCQRIATRAAEQLATAGVGLSEEDRDELTSLLSFLNEERDRSYDDGRSSDSAAYRDWHGALSRLLGATK